MRRDGKATRYPARGRAVSRVHKGPIPDATTYTKVSHKLVRILEREQALDRVGLVGAENGVDGSSERSGPGRESVVAHQSETVRAK
jgi:hypothetical protein